MPSTVGGTHDIRIDSNYFIVKPGFYAKRAAPMFGARFTTGDPDYNNLSFWQHWVQTCWVGGFGAQTWSDDAMYDEGVGIDASQHEVMVLSRDLSLTPLTAGVWTTDGVQPREFIVFNDSLYCLSIGDVDTVPPGRLYKYNTSTGQWALIKTFTERVRSMAVFAGYLVFGDNGATQNRMTTGEVFSTFNKPAAVTDVPYTMKVFRGKLYVGFGRNIWRLKNDFTWDGSTAFYTAEDITYFVDSELHLGFLYFASQNGHILRTDGNNTFDLWSFDTKPQMWGLRSFDGRLFVGVSELKDGTTASEAVLYQFSGAAVTELKRWGRTGYDISPGKLRVIGHRLMFGASNLLGMGSVDGFGVGMYDPVEDAYHLFASNQDSATYSPGTEGINNRVDDVFLFKGYVFCSKAYGGVFRTPLSFRDVSKAVAAYDTTPAGGSVASKNGGWYESSDFDAGTPGLRKLWNAITIHIDLPNAVCSAYVEVSSDGGVTWTPAGGSAAAATVSKTSAATRYSKTIVLQDNTAGYDGYFATRLKYRITLRTTNTAYSPQLRGVIVRYLPIPEPNWVWDVTLVLATSMALHDNTTEAVDTAAKLAALQTSFRNGELVEFQDIDGTIWAGTNQPGVLIQDMSVVSPVLTASGDGAREYEVRLLLHEAVESY